MIPQTPEQSPGSLGQAEMPDLVGMRLSDAVNLLRNEGMQARYEGSPDSRGKAQSVRVPKNWLLASQRPPPHRALDGPDCRGVERQALWQYPATPSPALAFGGRGHRHLPAQTRTAAGSARQVHRTCDLAA